MRTRSNILYLRVLAMEMKTVSVHLFQLKEIEALKLLHEISSERLDGGKGIVTRIRSRDWNWKSTRTEGSSKYQCRRVFACISFPNQLLQSLLCLFCSVIVLSYIWFMVSSHNPTLLPTGLVS